MTDFAPHPVIAGSTYVVGDLPLCRVLMTDDARFPWLMLLPRRADAEEIIDLTEADREQLMREISAASEAVRTLFSPLKINVGALGNKVRQLHVHVVARFESDAAWPGPIWGSGAAEPFPLHAAAVLVTRFQGALAAAGLREPTA